MSRVDGRPVVVVTGGGAGIGAAIALELGRRGALVATVDPMVSLDGSERLSDADAAPDGTTAGRIVAEGGAAEAFATSVTDPGLGALLAGLAERHGRLDAVVNVAGITRPTSFASGSEEDWREVVAVHLGGYLNVLRAALPIMAAAGHGRILGVTSGSGWRAADAGAYGCAKRAVAALTWELGEVAPPGVTVNAISPIAVTRMVTEALRRAASRAPAGGQRGSRADRGASAPSSGSATGGLSLGAMPRPEELAPLVAHLVDGPLDWLRGQVLFTGGSEVALVRPPALLDAVGIGTDTGTGAGAATEGAAGTALARLLEEATVTVLGPAESGQASAGGGNPRLPTAGPDADPLPPPVAEGCVVVADRGEIVEAVAAGLHARGVRTATVATGGAPVDPSALLAQAVASGEPARVDAVVVVLADPSADDDRLGGDGVASWRQVVAAHEGLVEHIPADARWSRAVADLAAAEERPVRLVTLVDARGPGGRSRAQVAAQLSRAASSATSGRVVALSVAVEAGDLGMSGALGAVAAHLACSAVAVAVAGAELVLADGWFGLRGHPRPAASLSLGGAEPPEWFDDVLRDLVGAPPGPA